MINFDTHPDTKQPDASGESGCFVVLHDLHVASSKLIMFIRGHTKGQTFLCPACIILCG